MSAKRDRDSPGPDKKLPSHSHKVKASPLPQPALPLASWHLIPTGWFSCLGYSPCQLLVKEKKNSSKPTKQKLNLDRH